MNMHVNGLATTGVVESPTLVNEALSLVKEYVKTVPVAPDDLPKLITSVYETLLSLAANRNVKLSGVGETKLAASSDGSSDEAAQEPMKDPFAHLSREPVVPVEESVHRDYLVCLLDGEKKLMLKRHLRARYGMEWEDYVRHFGLPADYPSVAPGYAAEKSAYAKQIGLGSRIDKTPKERGEKVQSFDVADLSRVGKDSVDATPARRVRRVRKVRMAAIA